MKLRLKILKENKLVIKEGRYDGLYDLAGIYPGSIDMFIKHFLEVPEDVSTARKSFIESSYGGQMDGNT